MRSCDVFQRLIGLRAALDSAPNLAGTSPLDSYSVNSDIWVPLCDENLGSFQSFRLLLNKRELVVESS